VSPDLITVIGVVVGVAGAAIAASDGVVLSLRAAGRLLAKIGSVLARLLKRRRDVTAKLPTVNVNPAVPGGSVTVTNRVTGLTWQPDYTAEQNISYVFGTLNHALRGVQDARNGNMTAQRNGPRSAVKLQKVPERRR
jgi:hypothetical protein